MPLLLHLASCRTEPRASNKYRLDSSEPTVSPPQSVTLEELAGVSGTNAVVAAKISILLAFVTNISVDEKMVVKAMIAVSLAIGF